MLFIDNKYTRWYYTIVSKAQQREISGYHETHHIIPKSLGGSNEPLNLVRLSAREHFICHKLLTKMVSGQNRAKMVHAAWGMANRENAYQDRYRVTSHHYESLKQERAALLAEQMLHNNPMTNPIHRVTHKQAVAARGPTRGNTGMPQTEETKAKIRAARANQVITEETKQKISAARTGTVATADTRAKMSATRTGKKQPTKQCEHCGKVIAAVAYARFHGSKCKQVKTTAL